MVVAAAVLSVEMEQDEQQPGFCWRWIRSLAVSGTKGAKGDGGKEECEANTIL